MNAIAPVAPSLIALLVTLLFPKPVTALQDEPPGDAGAPSSRHIIERPDAEALFVETFDHDRIVGLVTGGAGERFREEMKPAVDDGRLRLISPRWRQSTWAAFAAVADGPSSFVEVAWSMVMTRGTEGAGFLWLPVADHGNAGEAPAVEAWEAPSLPRTLGIGFDASNPFTLDPFSGSGNIYDRPQHEVSIHWDGMERVKRTSPVEFRDGKPHDVRVRWDAVTGGALVTVTIDEQSVFDGYFVPHLACDFGRPAFGARNGETAGAVTIDDLEVVIGPPVPAAAEPLHVVALDHVLNDASHHVNRGQVSFPENTDEYGRILCTLRLDKPASRFDPWDRLAHIAIVDDEGIEREIVRYITPYHRGHEWTVDVSDFRPWLRGTREVVQRCVTYGEGWVVTVTFDFCPGPAERYAESIVPLWSGACVIGDPDRPPSTFYEPHEVAIAPEVDAAAVRTVVTGHAMSPNTGNAAEFLPIWRTLTVNGASFRNHLWKTDNYLNPCRPQGGTWKYDRAGWAPGDVVAPWVVDVTDLVGPERTLSISYELDPYVNEARGSTSAPTHETTAYLVLYRDAVSRTGNGDGADAAGLE